MLQLANTNFPPALPPHVDPPLIIEHPSLRPLILEISDAEFRTGHLTAVSRAEPPKRRLSRGVALCVAVTVLTVISISARLAATARDTRVPSVAQAAATTVVASPASAPVIVAPPVVSAVKAQVPAPASSSKQQLIVPKRAPVIATPARASVAPKSNAPYGIDDPGF